MYELILEDPRSGLSGRIDERIIPLIQEAQNMVLEFIQNQRSEIQQEFLLKIYYEMALLYFYVNSCRDSRIDSDIAMHNQQMNWLTFTEMSAERFGEAMKMLLEADKIHSKLEVVQERMGERFEPQMSSFVEEIISILKRFSENR
jgi:hypothetical protein